jgi:AAA domain
MAPSLKSGTLVEMRQAHLILITGLPGTGKSTLARMIASRYGLPLICKDTIKEPLLDVIGASARAESRRLSDASFAVMFALARECLRAGTDLILEGNFRVGEHEWAVQSVAAAATSALAPTSEQGPTAAQGLTSIRLAQVLCRAAEPVRIARLQSRATDPSRHAGHRDADIATGPSPPTIDFLALPGERFTFESDARSATDVDSFRLQSLLDALDRWRDGDLRV